MNDRFPIFIVNLQAGMGAGHHAMRQVEEFVDRMGGEVLALRRGDDLATAVEQAICRGATDIIAVGGDGTVGGVAGAVAGKDVPMGIVPAGTANMFARELGIPLSISASLELIRCRHSIRCIDAMDMNGRRFIHQVVIGVGSEALSSITPMQKLLLGRSVYPLKGLSIFLNFRLMKVTALIDDREVHADASQIIIANSGILGARLFRLGTDIRVDDGKLDVVLMKSRDRTEFMIAGLDLLAGNYDQCSWLDFFPARRAVRVWTDPPTIIRADGESFGTTPMSLTVLPGAVNIIVPP